MKPQVIRHVPLTVVCPRIQAPVIDGRPDERKWAGASCLTHFVREDNSAAASRTTVWLGHDAAYLYVAARCEERNTAALQEAGSAYLRDLTSRDHVEVLIDPAHGHTDYCRFYAGPYEQTDTGRGSYRLEYREGPGSRWFHHKEQPDYGMYFRYASAIEDGKAWTCEMAIPFESLGAEAPVPGTVWGINLSRHTRWPVYRGQPTSVNCPYPATTPGEASYLAAMPGHYAVNPLVYADLVFDADAVQLVEADFGTPHFGANRAHLRFKTPAGGDLAVVTSVRPRRPGRGIDPGTCLVLEAADGRASGAVTWQARPYDDANVLALAVKDRATGRTLWQGSYEFGWESGSLPLYYLHLGEYDPVANPAPSDPDFLIRKAQFIAGRQPRFHRRNTALGAPSDFTLESTDGSVRFNLMDPGCMKAMAAYIYGLYDNDTDRLLGLLFLASQPAMMRAHTAYDAIASHRLETLSLLRFGSGYCGHMARVMAALLNHMEAGTEGGFHRGHCFGIGGHAVVMAEYRGNYVILDPKHPILYYRLDNTDLATVEELRREPEIARRAYPYYMPALMTFKVEHIAVDVPETLDGLGMVLPEGAPTA